VERKGWLMGLGAVAIVAVGAGIWASDGGGGEEAARLGEPGPRGVARRGGSAGSGGLAGSGAGPSGAGPRAPAVPADAGVLARVPPGAAPPGEPASAPEPELPGNAHDNEHSSGWRLGQARRRIAILEPRVARYRAALRGLDEQRRASPGAERQRTVLERTEQRLNELREQERELSAAARTDGTLADVDRGFEDGETNAMAERAPVEAAAP